MNLFKKISIALFFLLTLGTLGFVIAFNHYALDQYKKMDSPYDLNEEYNIKLISTVVRGHLGRLGLSDDSWILSPVLKWHRAAYKRALEVIPEEDGERVTWEIDYRIRDYKEYPVYKINEIYNFIGMLDQNTIRNTHINQVKKHVYKSGLIWYLIKNRDDQANKYYNNENYRRVLLQSGISSLKEIELERFQEEWYPTLRVYPLRILLANLVLFLDSKFYQKIECPERAELSRLIDSKFINYLKYYESFQEKKRITNQFEIAQNKYLDNKELLDQIINSCKEKSDEQ